MTDDRGPSRKRLRQTNLFECFSFKKEKVESFRTHDMNPSLPPEDFSQGESPAADSADAENRCNDNVEACDRLSPVPSSSDMCTESQFNLSQDLFPESDLPPLRDAADSPDSEETVIDEPEEEVIPQTFNRIPACGLPLPCLQEGPDHTVFCKLIESSEVPVPTPEVYVDKWDGDHVRMPCSPKSLYPFDEVGGGLQLKSRWDLIEKSLLSPIRSSYNLVNAILQYNSRYVAQWSFRGLHKFFEEELELTEAQGFFEHLLPKMVRLALRLPELVTKPIPLLKCGMNHSLTFSQLQVACLMCNAFFCTFPRRNTQKSNSEYAHYPEINFIPLFSSSGKQQQKVEKLKCLLNYFRRVTRKDPTGTLTFTRRSLTDAPIWSTKTCQLKALFISNTGLIEREGEGMLQVDFANKFVGGGVLGQGCVQEEIRFLISPELIVSKLFTEALGAKEVLVITGAEQFNDTSGYADSFVWEGDFTDSTSRDAWRRHCTEVVAMDALYFHRQSDQYKPSAIKRELNKAFCGFSRPGTPPGHLSAIATGNWGCGVFRGDPLLKALIQLMAASAAERDTVYFTFNNRKLCRILRSMYEFLVERKVTVGHVYNLLEQYHETSICGSGNSALQEALYDFIYSACDSSSTP
ncbi:poly(ADP-ribose) glycohydrolase-like [Ornithodoros turicata]|uniref:poly(ADP-ribose) glycohydrolase-like n=1 Tax=Ornithodoros turicata TaxID=34597 RepID=UPI0031388067